MLPPRAFDPETVLAVAAMDFQAGRFADARRGYSAVLQARPDDADVLYRLGSTEIQLGRAEAGLALIGQAIAHDPARADFHLGLAAAYARLDRLGDAVKSSGRAVALAPESTEAFGNLIRTAREFVNRGERFDPQAPPVANQDTRSVSVVVCSRDEQEGRRIREHYEELLAGRPFEIVHVYDARSLCEGYNRGFAKTSGDVVIFSHDDIEIVTEDFATRLLRHLSSCDVVGLAGTSQLAGAVWTSAGWPRLHGCLGQRYPAGRGFSFECYGPIARAPIEAVDGLFLAANRATCKAIPFDEASFDGFHFYDVDFSYRAFLAGYRIAVPWDILAVHDSVGSFDAGWQKYAEIFLVKHKGRISVTSRPFSVTWPCIDFADQAEMVAFHQAMLLAQSAPAAA
jgi:hypothetical protein